MTPPPWRPRALTPAVITPKHEPLVGNGELWHTEDLGPAVSQLVVDSPASSLRAELRNQDEEGQTDTEAGDDDVPGERQRHLGASRPQVRLVDADEDVEQVHRGASLMDRLWRVRRRAPQ